MNILIVESENDQFFIEALAKTSSKTKPEVWQIDEYKHSNLDEKKLTTQIVNALTDAVKASSSKIGIILDIDESTQKERINLINKCLKSSFAELDFPEMDKSLVNIKEFITCQINHNTSIKISCFFTNIDGKGELETILKDIKSKESIFADCLYDGWRNCLESKGKKIRATGEECDISNKELLKLWVDFYKRFDTLKRRERDARNTDWKGIMTGITKNGETLKCIRGNDIFDLKSERLTDIKSFLHMFDQ